MNDFVIAVNQVRDIPLALLLYATAPMQFKVVLSNFSCLDEYVWNRKRKSIDVYMQDDNIKFLRTFLGENLINCTNVDDFKQAVKGAKLCISKGREFFVLRQLAKKNIAMSSDRCYLNRFLDVIPHYGNDIKIVLDSEAWIDPVLCGPSTLDSGDSDRIYDYDFIIEHIDKFEFIDVLGENVNIMKKTLDRDLLKRAYGLDPSKPVAFLSFRKADDALTCYRSNDAFFDATKSIVEKYKSMGYSIVSRRRLGKFDLTTRSGSPEIARFDEIKHLIDAEANGSGGFPDTIWRALFMSDVLLLPDISSIADTEAALCSVPTDVPEDVMWALGDIQAYKKDGSAYGFVDRKLLSPRMRDFFSQDFFFGKYAPASKMLNNKIFLKTWFNTDIKQFWEFAQTFANA